MCVCVRACGSACTCCCGSVHHVNLPGRGKHLLAAGFDVSVGMHMLPECACRWNVSLCW